MAVEQIPIAIGVAAAVFAFFGVISAAMQKRILAALSFGAAVIILLSPFFAT